MSELINKYCLSTATRGIKSDKAAQLGVLLAMYHSHLPRHQEIIRILVKAIELVIDEDDICDEQTAMDLQNLLIELLSRCEKIAADGLQVMGFDVQYSDEGDAWT